MFKRVFSLASLLAVSPLGAATLPEMVLVGDAGNAPDSTKYGAVSYEYSIGKYEVTNAQYVDFLNAVAKSDPNGLYNFNMGNSATGGIVRSGTPGAYSYAAKAGAENKPVNYVSFSDAARYVNWLTTGDTEYGSYDLSVAPSVMVRLTPDTSLTYQIFVASENEWYKAAYYDPTKDGVGGYWKYATASDVAPGASAPAAGSNLANYNSIVGGPAAVGSYSSHSYYGTYDQEGNVAELTDTILSTGWVRRNAHFRNIDTFLGSGSRTWDTDGTAADSIGFRIVMLPVQIPEPRTVAFVGISLSLLFAGRVLKGMKR